MIKKLPIKKQTRMRPNRGPRPTHSNAETRPGETCIQDVQGVNSDAKARNEDKTAGTLTSSTEEMSTSPDGETGGRKTESETICDET